jgi:hypothetical protein
VGDDDERGEPSFDSCAPVTPRRRFNRSRRLGRHVDGSETTDRDVVPVDVSDLLVSWGSALLGVGLLATGVIKLGQGYTSMGVVLVAVGGLLALFVIPAVGITARWLRGSADR